MSEITSILVALSENNDDSSKLAFHLSAATHFALLEVDLDHKKVVSKKIEPSRIREANMLPAAYVASLGYKIVITRGIGPPALPPFRKAGVKVLTGLVQTLGETIESFFQGDLEELGESHDRLKHAHDLQKDSE